MRGFILLTLKKPISPIPERYLKLFRCEKFLYKHVTKLHLYLYIQYFGFESYQHQRFDFDIADLPNEGCTDLNNARSFPINP